LAHPIVDAKKKPKFSAIDLNYLFGLPMDRQDFRRVASVSNSSSLPAAM
jgi:hypothetical protein